MAKRVTFSKSNSKKKGGDLDYSKALKYLPLATSIGKMGYEIYKLYDGGIVLRPKKTRSKKIVAGSFWGDFADGLVDGFTGTLKVAYPIVKAVTDVGKKGGALCKGVIVCREDADPCVEGGLSWDDFKEGVKKYGPYALGAVALYNLADSVHTEYLGPNAYSGKGLGDSNKQNLDEVVDCANNFLNYPSDQTLDNFNYSLHVYVETKFGHTKNDSVKKKEILKFNDEFIIQNLNNAILNSTGQSKKFLINFEKHYYENVGGLSWDDVKEGVKKYAVPVLGALGTVATLGTAYHASKNGRSTYSQNNSYTIPDLIMSESPYDKPKYSKLMDSLVDPSRRRYEY